MKKDNRLPLKEKFLTYFKGTPIQKYAAAYIGKSEDTITDWKKEDSDFSDQIEKLKAEYIQQKLKKVVSPEWILERLFKNHFSKRQEYTGEDGTDLSKLIVINTVPTPLNKTT